MTNRSNAYEAKFKPIVLKRLIADCDITQAALAKAVDLARPTINLAVTRGYMPESKPDFKARVEAFLRNHTNAARIMQWLLQRGLSINDIWKMERSPSKRQKTKGHGERVCRGRKSSGAISPEDPDVLTINWEVEMIGQETLQHFKIFRNPFIDDLQKDDDIFMSDEHRYIEAAMLDAARHGGFLAVIGEVGSGKTVMRRKVVEQLRRDGDVLVTFPQIVDKTRLTSASICDAIVMDISDEKPRTKLEQKARQVQHLLLSRSRNKYRTTLIIEEAHDLSISTLKYLKRFYELEDGYRKLLGIVLIGQTELKHMFDEAMHVDMREVIRRVQIAEIRGLNGNIKDYLAFKFKRVGTDTQKIFAEDAFDAFSRRLMSRDRQNKIISHAYPLLVNNYAAKALNLACEMGEPKVTADVVMAI